MGECSEVKICEVQGIQKSRRLAVRENQQGLDRGNTLEPNGKDEQVSTRRWKKIQVLLVEKETRAKSKRHSSPCLVWAEAGSFVWTKNSIQVTEAEDKATKKALGLAVKTLV